MWYNEALQNNNGSRDVGSIGMSLPNLTQRGRRMDTTIVTSVSGIYKILNTKNGKKYIGSAVDITVRWSGHLWFLQNGSHHNRYLQNAWNKYGEGAFVFSILEECAPEDLLEREQSYLPEERTVEALTRDGYYNICPTAGNTRGVVFSDARKQKIAQKAIERTADPVYRAKMSDASKNQWQNSESRNKMMRNQANKIQMLTERNKKNWEDPEYREKHTESMRQLWKEEGRREELSQKISVKAKERMQNPELRARIAASMRKRWEDPEYRAAVSERKRKAKDGQTNKTDTGNA